MQNVPSHDYASILVVIPNSLLYHGSTTFFTARHIVTFLLGTKLELVKEKYNHESKWDE